MSEGLVAGRKRRGRDEDGRKKERKKKEREGGREEMREGLRDHGH